MSEELITTEVQEAEAAQEAQTVQEVLPATGALDEASVKKRKKRKRRSIYDVTPENDIRYRGPLSYRGLKLLGWISIVFSQLVFLMSTSNNITGSTEPIIFGDAINSMIIALGLPLLLFSNFAVLLNGRERYGQLLWINGGIAVGVAIVYLLVYQRYALGILSIFEGGKASAAVALDSYLSYIPNYNGFFTFNIYLDLFLCTLFMFFMDYKPKKFFKGKSIYFFRALSLLPVGYEVFCIIIKRLASDRLVTIPVAFYPFLTTKPPLGFMLFVTFVIYIKGRERRFIKHGKTHEQYREFLKTNTNSFHFSRMLAIQTVLFAIIDIIITLVLVGFYIVRNNIDPNSFTDMNSILSAFQWAQACGAGDMSIMILIAPIMLLFSYTRQHKNVLIDYAIPLVGVFLIILVYIEGIFNIAGELLRAGLAQAEMYNEEIEAAMTAIQPML